MTYAEKTDVPVARTRAALLERLEKHGCESIAFQQTDDFAAVTFQAEDRWIRFRLIFADPHSFALTETGKVRTLASRLTAREQHVRSRWRALFYVIGAKLEAIESGIEAFDEAFLAHVVLPDNSTVFESTQAAIGAAYRDGRVRPLLELEP